MVTVETLLLEAHTMFSYCLSNVLLVNFERLGLSRNTIARNVMT